MGLRKYIANQERVSIAILTSSEEGRKQIFLIKSIKLNKPMIRELLAGIQREKKKKTNVEGDLPNDTKPLSEVNHN